MIPRVALRRTPRIGFPRVSGDDPAMLWLGMEDVKFSPRERG